MTNRTSRNNPKIKQIHHLLNQRKQRDSSGLFVVEGIRHVGEACTAIAGVEYIVYAPDLLTSEFALQLVQEQSGRGVPCYPVDNDVFTGLASKDNPQGIIAIVRQSRLQLEELSAETFKWGVALVAPQDPGNIGSILRTIDAVGVSGLLLVDDPANNQFSADAYHPNSVRASMGAIFWYPVISTNFFNFTEWVQSNAYHIYGTSAHSSQDFRTISRYETPLILLMGSEREGLTNAQSAICDEMVRIPMQGRVTSLNLAIATGVMLYEIISDCK
jgi:TrmH family RNA methyltransferase